MSRAIFWVVVAAVSLALSYAAIKIHELSIYCTILGSRGENLERVPAEIGLLFAVIAWVIAAGVFVACLFDILLRKDRE